VFRAALSRIEMQVSCHASPPAENRTHSAVYGDRRKKACEAGGQRVLEWISVCLAGTSSPGGRSQNEQE